MKKKRNAISPRLRFKVMLRDNHRCVYCGAYGKGVVLHLDHIKPVSLGGKDTEDNLVTACQSCNLGKSATQLPKEVVDRIKSNKQPEIYGMNNCLIGKYFLTYDNEDL